MNQMYDRIRESTDPDVNQKIDEQMECSVRFYSTQTKVEISKRIDVLEHEWDIERVLITNASSISIVGLLLGLTRNRAFFMLPGIVLPFLLYHGVKGWCPPMPILRRMGFRTRNEIDCEKFALKALRGDFETMPPSAAEEADKMPRAEEAFVAVTQ